MYKQSAKLKLRFSTSKGILSTEQLFNLDKESLIQAEESLQEILEKSGKTPRRRGIAKSNEVVLNELRLSIVSDVLDTIEREEELATKRADIRRQKQEILNLMAEKQEEARRGKSLEELQKELDALENQE